MAERAGALVRSRLVLQGEEMGGRGGAEGADLKGYEHSCCPGHNVSNLYSCLCVVNTATFSPPFRLA